MTGDLKGPLMPHENAQYRDAAVLSIEKIKPLEAGEL
jgi:hypothetical protein